MGEGGEGADGIGISTSSIMILIGIKVHHFYVIRVIWLFKLVDVVQAVFCLNYCCISISALVG